MSTRGRAVGLVCWVATLGLVAALPAAAQADAEPNDLLVQAEGPMLGGVHTGSVGNAFDWDWYSFYAASQTQLAITVTNTTNPEVGACGFHVNLRDATGEHIYSTTVDTGDSTVIRRTTPVGTTQYMLDFDSPCAGDDESDTGPASYSFSLDPAPAFLAGPPTAVGLGSPTAEPNESFNQPYGPLLGGQGYSGALETYNDEDWYYLYSSGLRAIDVAIYNTGEFAHDCNPEVTAYRSTGGSFAVAEPIWQHVGHVTLRPRAGGTRFFLKVADGCGTSFYQLRVNPSNAVTTSVTGPSVKSPSCLGAEARHLSATYRLNRTQRRLKRAGSRAAKRKLRRQVSKQKRQLKRARRAAVRLC